MTPEMITTVISAAGVLVTLVGAFVGAGAWMIRRVDGQFERSEERMDRRFAQSEARMEARMDVRFAQIDERFAQVDARFDRVEERLTGVERELVEVKIAVARLEGPPRHLIAAR